MFSTTLSGALQGIEGVILQIEVDISNGFPCLEIVGLPGSEVREAKERVRASIKNLGISIPPQRILVNLSPADVKKTGTAYDLPIAIGILKSMGILKKDCTQNKLLLGELGLDGTLKAVTGVFPILARAYKEGITECIVAKGNVEEARLFGKMKVYSVDNMAELVTFFREGKLPLEETKMVCQKETEREERKEDDFAAIKGQESAKRAALIAAAGRHNFLLIGPPGSSKTMILRAMPQILPPMSDEERLESASIESAMGCFEKVRFLERKRPFVEMHHSATSYALIGGGASLKAGAMSLAHNGVLFLDELPEFKREVLDAMRQPLEQGKITHLRYGRAYQFQTQVMLVAAMNPCPCGYYPDKNKCQCMPYQIRKYVSHISGPILDRIDIVAETQKMCETMENNENYSTEHMKEQVRKAVSFQKRRYQKVFHTKKEEFQFNGRLNHSEIEQCCFLSQSAEKFLQRMEKEFGISKRGCDSLIKVARTIADLEENEEILEKHISMAAIYRLGCERYFYG